VPSEEAYQDLAVALVLDLVVEEGEVKEAAGMAQEEAVLAMAKVVAVVAVAVAAMGAEGCSRYVDLRRARLLH
jgi:hypothetical protein